MTKSRLSMTVVGQEDAVEGNAVRRIQCLVVPTKWLAAILIIGISPWCYVLLTLRRPSDVPFPAAETLPVGKATMPLAGQNSTSAGPWGELDIVPIVISPPLEFAEETLPDIKRNDWYFPNTTLEELHNFFANLNIAEEDRKQLEEQAHSGDIPTELVIRPKDEVVLRLPETARAAIYNQLSTDSRNRDQANAFRYRCTELSEWLGQSDLSDQVLQIIERLVYRHGTFLFFADLPLVLTQVTDAGIQSKLIKALMRQQTLLVKVNIRPESDVDGMVSYWGGPARSKDLRPLLESLRGLPQGARLDIAHLLSAFARMRLYTYPVPGLEAANGRDCHWTSLNFFDPNPDDRFTDPGVAAAYIEQHFHPIYAEPRFGDLVLFLESESSVFHSATYVADDLVFTKNGSRPTQPWLLMRLADMRDFYPRKSVQVRYYRRNAS